MEFPVSYVEFENWKAEGSAVFLTNRAILVPEIAQKEGAIYSKNFISENKWNIDI